MKNIALFLLFVIAIIGLYGFAFSLNAEEPSGKKIFVDSKCSMCHSVESADITSKKKDAIDMSGVGNKNNAEFLAKYLTKKEKLNDKEHKTAFKGTEEDLQALAAWLESLKTEEAGEKTE